MKPATLLQSPPIKKETDLYGIERHFYEANLNDVPWEKNTKLEAAYYIDECFDGERGLAVFSLWFEGKAFMICQDAGRGNQDYNQRYLLDLAVYQAAITYLQALAQNEDKPSVVELNTNIPELDTFYGWETSKLYNSTLQPKFKEGDIVMAEVMENHLSDPYNIHGKAKAIWTRCKVVKVNQFNPTFTYRLAQLDRRWEKAEEYTARGGKPYELIVTDLGNGELGAQGNDKTVKQF